MKSVFLLFLVLTRAKVRGKSVFFLLLRLTLLQGAEPLFLHVLRPFVKPYSAIVDPMLELSRDLGDFFFALSQVPLDYILSLPLFPSWRAGELEDEPGKSSSGASISSADSGSLTRASSHSSVPVPADHAAAVQTSHVQSKRHGTVRSVSDNHDSNGRPSVNHSEDSRTSRDHPSKSASTTSLPAYSEYPSHDPPRYSQTLSKRNGHQIWYPPTSASPASSQEAPVATLGLPETAPEYHSPEWRTYPAFPSAYPPTPLPALASLPSSVTRRSGNDHRVVSDSAYPPIPEDEQGFDELLGRQHEGHPAFVRSSSNSDKIPPGVNGFEPSQDTTRQQDGDTLLDDSICSSEAGLSEDDFGTSLRTPHRPPVAMPSGAYSSADSLTSALTTTDNAHSLRTKTSSDSLSSGSSSLAGRKRAHETFQGKGRNAFPTPQSRNATLRGRLVPPSIPQDPLQSSASEGENENELADDDGVTKAKRQRVLDPLKRKSTVRPVGRGLGSPRKTLPLRSATARSRTVATVSRATLRSKAGSVTTNSTIKGRQPALVGRQVIRGGPQGVIKSSSTSSQSGTSKGLRGKGISAE